MKKFLLGAVGFVALVSAAPASAADLAARPYTKAPPMIAAIYDWSGFYVGANGGWGSSRNCWDFLPVAGGVTPEGCHDATGGVAGGQIGYRWQSANWVFGVEAQGDWANLRNDRISQLLSRSPDAQPSGLSSGNVSRSPWDRDHLGLTLYALAAPAGPTIPGYPHIALLAPMFQFCSRKQRLQRP